MSEALAPVEERLRALVAELLGEAYEGPVSALVPVQRCGGTCVWCDRVAR